MSEIGYIMSEVIFRVREEEEIFLKELLYLKNLLSCW